jgi:iron complex transport system substrate-binding protein
MRSIAKWALAAIAMLAFGIAACGDDDDGNGGRRTFDDNPTPIAGIATPATFPLTVQRSDGRALTLGSPPSRIVSLSPAATEIIFALGQESRLAAVDNQADFPEAAANFPTKVDAFEPNVEAITALNPDLVLVATDSGGIVGRLDALNIPVLFRDIDTSIRTIEDIFGEVRVLGQITGADNAALDLIQALSGRVRAIESRLQGKSTATGPLVFHELDSTFFTASEDTFIGDLYRRLHARNVAGDGGGNPYPQLTQEAIIAANPDVIILADEEFGVSVESVKARPGWAAIEAVINDRIHGLNPDIISRPGPRIVDALEQLAALLYPEEFGDAAGSAQP